MRSRLLTAVACHCLLVIAILLSGCEPQSRLTQEARPPIQAQPIGPPQVETIAVEAYSGVYVEQIDVPGVSVRGFETTELMSQVGGQVKTLGQVAGASGEKEEVDIGSEVKRGDVLAVLEVPVVQSELLEKTAMVGKANSEVKQAEAAQRQKAALVASAQASLEETKAAAEEQQSVLAFRQSDFDNYTNLYKQNSTTQELLDKARFQLDAAKSTVKTVAAQIRSAEKQVDAARADADRGDADLVSAQAEVRVAEAAEGRLRAMVEFASIRAPFDGVITKRMVDHGAYVRPATSNSGATPLFEVTRNDRLRVVADVPARRAKRIDAGQTVVFHSITGVPGATVEGQVTKTGVVRDRDMRTLSIEVHLPRMVPDARYFKQTIKSEGGKSAVQWVKHEDQSSGAMIELNPGMDGVVTILRPWQDLVAIPSTALAFDAGRAYVTIVSDGVCSRRYVDVVHDDTATVLLNSGVSAGEQVVLSRPGNFAEGASVMAKLRAGS